MKPINANSGIGRYIDDLQNSNSLIAEQREVLEDYLIKSGLLGLDNIKIADNGNIEIMQDELHFALDEFPEFPPLEQDEEYKNNMQKIFGGRTFCHPFSFYRFDGGPTGFMQLDEIKAILSQGKEQNSLAEECAEHLDLVITPTGKIASRQVDYQELLETHDRLGKTILSGRSNPYADIFNTTDKPRKHKSGKKADYKAKGYKNTAKQVRPSAMLMNLISKNK